MSASVAGSRPDPKLLWLDGLAKSAAETQVQVLEFERADAPPLIAKLLKIEPHRRALHVLRLRKIGALPVMVT